ncbi:BaiN/RdsA family NAD(P)/FAD-dependent oxidoreductase [Sunxiuqinia dokdonensis]|uniref:FAD-dependent oxidoreductase n=1 Tax=Sunxiuqinia dokdonensis TaxID=1409788 RepID=A0A0L8V6N1_9BACT|nr:NAD(P)/FAD-dependent oxidoreductase [Sunxiuqinia dokdonensis]KOH44018.1 FAD-dependent oxidoreductase [Sunxiuqinia dokdonensis]
MLKKEQAKAYDVVVVGAGPAGLIAAGRAAELGARVLLVEKMRSAGRKLLITGKGRCNISNDAHQSTYFKNIFPNGKYLKPAFGAFFSKDIIQLLANEGVETTVERGGRIFPTSNSALEVLNALMSWVKKRQVNIIYSSKVEQILVEKNQITGVRIDRNGQSETVSSPAVIICTGGKSYPATGSTGDGYQLAGQLGHSIQPARPALVPLITSGNMAAELQGLSLKNVNASVWIDNKKVKEEFGEMLFAHYGLTGPIILTLSRLVVDALDQKKQVRISIDLKPALDENKLDARLIRDLDANGKKQIENIFKEWLPSKLIPVFLNELQIDGKKQGHQMNSKERRKVMLLMKNLTFDVTDYRGFKEAIITAGGVSTSEIDSKTMQSKLIKNLYFAGEVIDLDANTGGYNLQIAYSTAWLAATSLAKNIIETAEAPKN